MKQLRWYSLFLIFGLCTCLVSGQSAKIYDWPTVSATGNTTTLDLTKTNADNGNSWVSANQTVSVSLGTGTNSVCTWQVEASDDGTQWYTIGAVTSCTAANYVAIQQIPLRRLHVKVISYTGTAKLAFHWTGSD